MLDHLGDVRSVTRANFTKDALPDPDDAADEPVALHKLIGFHMRTQTKSRGRTQKTPIEFQEQYGGRSGLIIQNMPWSCQQMKKMMKR